MPSHHVNVTEGNSLTLRCDVIGLPTPSVVWLNETDGGTLNAFYYTAMNITQHKLANSRFKLF